MKNKNIEITYQNNMYEVWDKNQSNLFPIDEFKSSDEAKDFANCLNKTLYNSKIKVIEV